MGKAQSKSHAAQPLKINTMEHQHLYLVCAKGFRSNGFNINVCTTTCISYKLASCPFKSCQLASCPDLLHVLANSYKLASCPFIQLPTCIVSKLATCQTCNMSLQTATNLHHGTPLTPVQRLYQWFLQQWFQHSSGITLHPTLQSICKSLQSQLPSVPLQ